MLPIVIERLSPREISDLKSMFIFMLSIGSIFNPPNSLRVKGKCLKSFIKAKKICDSTGDPWELRFLDSLDYILKQSNSFQFFRNISIRSIIVTELDLLHFSMHNSNCLLSTLRFPFIIPPVHLSLTFVWIGQLLQHPSYPKIMNTDLPDLALSKISHTPEPSEPLLHKGNSFCFARFWWYPNWKFLAFLNVAKPGWIYHRVFEMNRVFSLGFGQFRPACIKWQNYLVLTNRSSNASTRIRWSLLSIYKLQWNVIMELFCNPLATKFRPSPNHNEKNCWDFHFPSCCFDSLKRQWSIKAP